MLDLSDLAGCMADGALAMLRCKSLLQVYAKDVDLSTVLSIVLQFVSKCSRLSYCHA